MGNKIIYKNDNITIELTEIEFLKTYRNLLCGLPTKELNGRLISDGMERAKLFCETESVFLIEPKQTEIFLKTEYKLGIPFRLPYFTCIGNLICYSGRGDLLSILDSNSNVSGSNYINFGLLWFQEELSIEISQGTKDFIIRIAENLSN